MFAAGCLWTGVLVGWTALGAPEPAPQPVAGAASREFTFKSAGGREHRALLSIPAPADRRGVSVLLIGGGAAWDEHWTAPGEYTIQGNSTRVTLDGRPTRDGETIAAALVGRGFVVMQWSSIPADDAPAAANSAMAAGIPFPESVALTHAALAALREQPEVDEKRIALLGHSLGATRACQVADDGVVAMVFLAGAYLSTTSDPPRRLAAEAFKEFGGLDADTGGTVTRTEFDAWRAATPVNAALPPEFGLIDRDHDGVLRGWEVASARAIARLTAGDDSVISTKPTIGGGPWPVAVLGRTTMPVLAVFGGLDAMAYHGPWLERQFQRPPTRAIDVWYIPDRGHQIGPERDGLIGPIDPTVVARLADWLVRETAPR
ncbi:MAG: hypothetical protein ACKVU4_01740 [Phycisphaerales bacterium]